MVAAVVKSRDDFPQKVKARLEERAGHQCSNPSCRAPTTGPELQEDASSVKVGRAAHITAASPGGPRYDASLNPRQRSAQGNGIWLCAICADKVDKDEAGHPEALLRQWKKDAEAAARRRLGKSKSRDHDPYRAREVQVRRELKLRDELRKGMLRPFDPHKSSGREKPYDRFVSSKLIVHSLEDTTYPTSRSLLRM